MPQAVSAVIILALLEWCQDFFGRGPHFGSRKTWRAAASIASSWPLGLGGKKPFFPFVRNSRPGGEGGGRGCKWKNFQCGPRATTEVRPTNRAGRTSQFRGPHYNANFWTLGGPQFMTSRRAAFGPRAALFTPLIYRLNRQVCAPGTRFDS